MRNSIFSAVALATSSIALAATAVPAYAQSKSGIAIVDVDAALGDSNAAKTASQQMQVTYKANIDQVQTRQGALETELKQKRDALQAEVNAAGKTPTAAQRTKMQSDYEALQKRAQEAQNELRSINQPLQLARAYVIEQINDKMPQALRNVMTKNKMDILVKAGATEAYQPSVDLTNALVAELNTLVPNVSIVPPQGWRPGQEGNGEAAPAANAPAAPANQPRGR